VQQDGAFSLTATSVQVTKGNMGVSRIATGAGEIVEQLQRLVLLLGQKYVETLVKPVRVVPEGISSSRRTAPAWSSTPTAIRCASPTRACRRGSRAAARVAAPVPPQGSESKLTQ
jgi:hypothetical protein